ncbi:acylphosphatase [Bosea sp. (in: a-proteobacteria)]|jgi:acylphosphatase|uniref:acylphosphatase n=1 Tax=Bosea sp. (in: a-proteobacteria) TaxID=1871050 RepID=UPI003F701D72
MTLHIVISGLVQGVGYRQWLRERALAAGVAGWVRNRSDGTVEAVLSGAPETVELLAAEARKGPRGARVADVDSRAAQPSLADQASDDFVIARSI